MNTPYSVEWTGNTSDELLFGKELVVDANSESDALEQAISQIEDRHPDAVNISTYEICEISETEAHEAMERITP